MTKAIAIIGMACRYPDARSPHELWENALAQRQAFRRLPDERLRLADYFSDDRSAPDCTYSTEAALIEGYEFDRLRFRVSGNAYRSTDLAHWLALETATQALSDAGLDDERDLPRETTGVFLGNTLTGEFARANLMRLRWPYVRRVLESEFAAAGWPPERRRNFLLRIEAAYKIPFPQISEETLAGSLSNTIAGRICNHFDLKGGGYTIDGACASSLLAVAQACAALAGGDLDLALAGGVDLSLDPFELVGFAKAGALAHEEMRVYDVNSDGFWPGEGCGFVALMRYEEAVAQQRRIYALIRGWGISSDGKGGITRPEVAGQLLALSRAYRRAGFGIETIGYFEGHGTGTAVGDATELKTLAYARRSAARAITPAAIGSIKANIGHTKAAAGIAGLIKASMALHTQILPPTTGCEKPHPELQADPSNLRALSKGELWPKNCPLRAGVSAMGFGGINAHLALESVSARRRAATTTHERCLLLSAQDAELFLLDAPNDADLLRQAEHLIGVAGRLSRAEMTDLAARQEKRLTNGHLRAAVVAATPSELADRLATLREWLATGVTVRLDTRGGVFLGKNNTPPRIGFLFPGQGSPVYLDGGAWSRRFGFLEELYVRNGRGKAADNFATDVAQPAVVASSIAGLRVLRKLRIEAEIGIGHSLGEITALHWAGALSEEGLLRIAIARGKAMMEMGQPNGAMASIGAGQQEIAELLNGEPVVIAGLNSPSQTIISGEANAVATCIIRAQAKGIRAIRLPVSHAFHSQLVAPAVPELAAFLSLETFQPLQRVVISTVTGAELASHDDLAELILHQVIAPVRFMEACKRVNGADLLIEVGPGQVLTDLVAEFISTPALALNAGSPSLQGLLQIVGAAFALGAPVKHEALFEGRFTRPFDWDWRPRFFINPCELAPLPVEAPQGASADAECPRNGIETQSERRQALNKTQSTSVTTSPLQLIRSLTAERAELPPQAVRDDDRLLGDLHLNSITVSQIVAEAARRLSLPPPVTPTDYSTVTVAEAAQALDDLVRTGSSYSKNAHQRPLGVDSWIRTFTVELVEEPLLQSRPLTGHGVWRLIAPPDYPLADSLRQAFASSGGGGGVIVCLPPEPDERHAGLLLEGARAVLSEKAASRFVLAQHGGGAASFAKTLHMEAPGIITCVVDAPLDHTQTAAWVRAEAHAATGYSEAYYDASGSRRVPVLRLSPQTEESEAGLPGADDTLLVTGGGKGIAAECALHLARETGVRLALLGRARPEDDADLAANLKRFEASGVRFKYAPVDVTNANATRAAIREIESDLGVVTAILHGAGANVPQLLSALDEDAFLRTLSPKLDGARNVLAGVDPDRLRLFISFGSLIARTGMPGEADYAVANEWLARLTERWQMAHPHCRCLALEWSVWSGVGMGERLGRIDALSRQGITPIPPDEGISALLRILKQPSLSGSVVITGRFGEATTLRFKQQDLPLLRFLEQPKVYYPNVELIADAELSTETDPYVNDHVFRGQRLFPAVLGLEAMAQVAMALAGTDSPPIFESVKFHRPVVIPESGSVMIRLAAMTQESGRIEVALRSGETAFQMNHFQAMCRWPSETDIMDGRRPRQCFSGKEGGESLIPEVDLYGKLLFHSGRFRRLRAYRCLSAIECMAEITPYENADWFWRYLPSTLALGDPAARDAAIHAIQSCIPHATVLPVGVDRIQTITVESTGLRTVHARERSRNGDVFVYDLIVTDSNGQAIESWEGLQLRAVELDLPKGTWAPPLWSAYIERRMSDLIPDVSAIISMDLNLATQRLRNDEAIKSLLERRDGNSDASIARNVSVAHASRWMFAVAGERAVGCEIEPVTERSVITWRKLLGPEHFSLAEAVSRETGEDLNRSATRVRATFECMKKAGAMIKAPLSLGSLYEDGWVTFSSGSLIIATFIITTHGAPEPMALAALG